MLKNFLYYLCCEKYPIAEHMMNLTDSYNNTKTLMSVCPFSFRPTEKIRLFLFYLFRVTFSTVVIGLLYTQCIQPLTTELFNIMVLPNWMLPLCLFLASNIVTSIWDELIN